MEKRVIAIFVFLIFMMSFASAEIFFSQQPKEVYSFGDQIKVVLGSDGSGGWVNAGLVCDNSSKKMVFFHYVTPEETNIPFSVPLTKDFLRDMQGDCYFSLLFNNQTKESLHFDISSSLDVKVNFNNKLFNPNESVQFSGTVSKKNGDKVNGFAEVSFPYNAVQIIVPVTDGKFNGNISLQENIPAGEHDLSFFVYQKNEAGEVTNFYLSNSSISVMKKPRLLEIEVPENIAPNNELDFTAHLYDQADSIIDGVPVAFTLVNPNGEQVLNILSETEVTEYYTIQKNAQLGFWNLTAKSEGLISESFDVFINANVEAEFLLINNTLVIKNVGNVPYDKLVQIKIGENYTEILALNISLLGSVEFDLEAPDGEYSIFVDDGKVNLEKSTFLTGNVIGIKDSRSGGIGLVNNYMFSWVIIIGILGLFIFVSARKVVNRKSVLSSKSFNPKTSKVKGGVVKVNVTNSGIHKTGPKEDTADNSLVIQGDKQKATLLSLKIDNQEEIFKGSNASKTIEDSVNSILESKGKVYRSGKYIVGVYAPVITRTFDNGFDVIKIADAISHKLNEHNKKYSPKINFGIGINDGNIIAETRNGKLSFTPLGNAIQNVKKISDMAKNDYLLGEEINKGIGSKIKTIANPEKFNVKTYRINDVLDKTQHAQFLNKFLDRNHFKDLNKFRI